MSTATTSNGLVEPGIQEFEGIFREHADLVFATACSITRRGEDAEDVVQTVFIRLLRSGLPPEFRRNPRGYLYRAAINQSLTIIRDQRRHPTTDLSIVTEAEFPADTNSKEEIHRKLHEAIAELPPQSAEIVILRYVHHRSDADIANLLGKSRVTISPPGWRLVGFPTDNSLHYFQIEGVADDPEHVTKDELKLMLQTLFEDRFKARVHLEAREVDGYALTIAKSGIKFKETSGDATAGRGAPAAVPGATSPIARGAGGRGDDGACVYVTIPKIFVRGKCGMREVTSFLRQLLMLNGPPPIADNTGLMYLQHRLRS